ncbi:MAG: RodZ domain-containing protein [Desulfovibrionaceae bacterium]
MSLKEAGEILRTERERKGLSVDEVMRKTRISRRNLESLEAGDPAGLPHEVYVRGFIKALSALYGVPVEDLRRMIDGHYGGGVEEELSPQAPPEASVTVPRPVPIRSGRRRAWLVLLILCVVFGGLVWGGIALFRSNVPLAKFLKPGVVKRDDAPKEPAPDIQPAPLEAPAADASVSSPDGAGSDMAAAAVPDTTAAADGVPGQVGTASQAPEQGVPAAEPMATVPDPALVAPGAPQADHAAAAGQAGQAKATTASTTRQDAADQADNAVFTHSLEIVARGECWVGASIDGKPKDFILREGRTVTLRFNEALSVKFGNASAVTVRFDGKDYPFETPPSQVLTLQFP